MAQDCNSPLSHLIAPARPVLWPHSPPTQFVKQQLPIISLTCIFAHIGPPHYYVFVSQHPCSAVHQTGPLTCAVRHPQSTDTACFSEQLSS